MSTDPRVLVLEEMRAQTALLRQILAAVSGAAIAPTSPSVRLDGPHGDPVVRKKDPHDWAGDNMKGKRFSECPADYLDLLASREEHFAQKETDPQKRRYNELDAARARGWAARLRAGWTPPVSDSTTDENGDYVAAGSEKEPSW